jgi:hypothetical protein
MDRTPAYYADPGERFSGFVDRGLRIARRLAISFALSVVAAIVVGAAATDNGFAQFLITAFASLAFWLPIFFVISWVERLFTRRRPPPGVVETSARTVSPAEDAVWRRLAAATPKHRERIAVLQRSIGRSRLALANAKLDPGAHDICLLIDRRLPELIDKELDDLPPDDRNRGRQLDELVDLIEQFARDCSRRNTGPADRHSAEVLRRRFEDHLREL